MEKKKRTSKKVKLPTVEGVEDLGNTEEGEKKIRAPRKKATIKGHIENYDYLFNLLDSEIERKSKEKEKGIRTLRKVRKTLKVMRKEVPQVTKSKEARQYASTNKNRKSGINIKYNISKELSKFLKIDKKEKISRTDAFCAICVYCNLKENETREQMLKWKYLNPEGERNLQNKHNRKSIIPDKALLKLLNYEQYKKDVQKGKITMNQTNPATKIKEKKVVTDDLLYYHVIQILMSPHFLSDEK